MFSVFSFQFQQNKFYPNTPIIKQTEALSFFFLFFFWRKNRGVRAKNEADGLGLTWAHNLFVMWALDFLAWVVPNTETQWGNFSLRIPLLPLLLFSCCSLAPILSFL